MQTWLGFPFVFAMTTGVLQAIPDDLYEAATMDGASAFTRLRTITLPLFPAMTDADVLRVCHALHRVLLPALI